MRAITSFAAITALVAGGLTVTVPVATAATASAAKACAWRVVPSQTRGVGGLTAVAATSPRDAWAVGSFDTGSGARTLIEHWTGSSWKIVPSPDPATGQGETDTLDAVVAISKTSAWAFGFYEKATTSFRTLVEHWNGTGWKVVPSPNSGPAENAFTAASAVSRSDIWAVGYSGGPGPRRTLVERWKGARWRIVPSPSPGPRDGDSFLFGVAATSASHAWAVGTQPASFSQTLALRWNGTRWLTAKTANPGQGDRFLQAVATPSATSALAVGSYVTGQRTRALAERWTGSTWSLVPAASPGADFSSLQSIAARNARYAWAVGTQRTTFGARFTPLAERWTGHAWTQVKAPSPGRGDDALSGIAAVRKSGFWAVGSAGPAPLIERYC